MSSAAARRLWQAIVREFTPPSMPRPRPSERQLAEGHLAVGTFDPDFVNDILVARWPRGVNRALEPVRFEGPGALRARVWSFLAGCSFVVMWAGNVLTPLLLCGVIFGGDMFTDLPAWFHPGVALATSIGAVPLGLSWSPSWVDDPCW